MMSSLFMRILLPKRRPIPILEARLLDASFVKLAMISWTSDSARSTKVAPMAASIIMMKTTVAFKHASRLLEFQISMANMLIEFHWLTLWSL